MDDFSKYQQQLGQVSSQLSEQNVLESATDAKTKAKVLADRFKQQVVEGITDPLSLDLLKKSAEDFAESKGIKLKGGIYGAIKDKLKGKIPPAPRQQVLPPTAEEVASRQRLNQNIKFREGDITPEDIVRGDKTIGELKQSIKDRYSSLTAQEQQEADARLTASPSYRSIPDITADQSLSADAKRVEAQNHFYLKQDVLGDVEAMDRSVVGAAVPGATVRGSGKEVVGKMSDEPKGRIGLAEATEESTTEDFSPEGILVTAGLGLATLFSGLFGHKHDEGRHPVDLPPVANPSTQFGA